MLVLIGGCTNKSGGSSKLNDYEDLFVSAFSKKLSSFKAPSSVTVVNIISSGCNGAVVKFTVSAKNSFGGVNTETYVLPSIHFTINDISCSEGYLIDYDTVYTEGNKLIPSKSYCKVLYIGLTEGKDNDSSYNIGKINEALNEYKNSMGWS